MDKQKIIIYFLVIIMVLSVIGLGIVLAFDSGSDPEDDVAQQLQELQEQQQAQQESEAAALSCQPLPQQDSADPRELPEEPFIPEGDVTELETVDLKEGDGEAVQPDSCLVVYYHGTLASDGSVFDSAYETGTPAKFPLTGVIEGWQQGLLGMKEGGVRRLVIPSELAYGSAGNPPVIAPDSDLVFIVELVRIEE